MMLYYLIKTEAETIGMYKVSDPHFIGTVHCFPNHKNLTLEKISETEFTSYEALELFTVFESVIRTSSVVDHRDKTSYTSSFVDFYDPNFYEVVEHKGSQRIAERMDRRFLAKGT